MRKLGKCILWELKKLVHDLYIPAIIIVVMDLILWALPKSACAAIEKNFGFPITILSIFYSYSVVILIIVIFKRMHDEFTSGHHELERLCYPSIWIRSLSRMAGWIISVTFTVITSEFGVKMLDKFSDEYLVYYTKRINAPLWFIIFEIAIIIPVAYRAVYFLLYQRHNVPHPAIAFLLVDLFVMNLTSTENKLFIPLLVQFVLCIFLFVLGNRLEERLIE